MPQCRSRPRSRCRRPPGAGAGLVDRGRVDVREPPVCARASHLRRGSRGGVWGRPAGWPPTPCGRGRSTESAGLEAGLVGLPTAANPVSSRAHRGRRGGRAAHVLDAREPTGEATYATPAAQLAGCRPPPRVVPATLQVVDIAGLVRGASTARGWETSSWAPSAPPTRCCTCCAVRGRGRRPPVRAVDPLDDAETVELELVLADRRRLSGAPGACRQDSQVGRPRGGRRAGALSR